MPVGTLALGVAPSARVPRVPVFFVYAAFGVAASVARFVAHNHPHPYFATYWITEAGYCLLGILAMHEVLRSTLGNLTRVRWSHLIWLSVTRTRAGPFEAAYIGDWLSFMRMYAANHAASTP